MKISSRSILSPGRTGSAHNPPQISLSTSLSHRLRTSRSIKAATSPAMFPATGKKRGSGFDNPEPTSPKVTCIGQVRVKTKKKYSKNNLRSLSKRRDKTGEDGFSKLEHSFSNNQRWVHLPLTICEALRTFGSEVSCLFPCRSSCSSSTQKEENMGNKEGTCAVVARWLVAVNDGDDGGNDKDGDDNDGKLRRHVFEDLEIVNDSIIGSKEEGRVSICVPPKNALLLMRCRSDLMKMEELTNRVFEPGLDQNDEQIEDEDEKIMVWDENNDQEIVEINSKMEVTPSFREENVEMKQTIHEEKQSINERKQSIHEEEESMFIWCLFEEFEESEEEEVQLDMEDALEEFFEDEIFQEIETGESNIEKVKYVEDTETGESNIEKVKYFEDTETGESNIEKVKNFEEGIEDMVTEFSERNEVETHKENTTQELPECLLLMMYEPKLSMEVSKETWVCSSDFFRHHSSRKKSTQVKSTESQNKSKVKASSTENEINLVRTVVVQYEPGLHQPARSSCSLPAPWSMASVSEHKLVDTKGFEPFVLKRCNSEPVRTENANLAPETCFWINRNKPEPPRRASFGVGKVGLGF